MHVVYSARDIARQVPAREWQESVKHRYPQSFGGSSAGAARARRDSPMWFWRVQGLPDVLNRWALDLPPERVHLVTVPHRAAPRASCGGATARAFGIDPAGLPEAGRANPSLGIDETAMLRELNRRLKRPGLGLRAYAGRGTSWSTRPSRAGTTCAGSCCLRPADWATEIADEWIDYVEGAGIDVVGDVDDLRPVFPDDDAWQDPDRGKPRRVADAALDALVAVVLEAAVRRSWSLRSPCSAGRPEGCGASERSVSGQ